MPTKRKLFWVRSIFWSHPIILIVNIVLSDVARRNFDISSLLNSKYINIYPLNVNYIIALKSFGVGDNNIAYVCLSMANSALISYFYFIIYFIISGIMAPMRRIKYGIYNPPLPVSSIIYINIASLICFIYLYVSNFSDSILLYKLSIHRPIFISVSMLNIFLYAATFSLSLGAAALFESIFTTFAWRGKKNG